MDDVKLVHSPHASGADHLHARLIFAAPGIGEGAPIDSCTPRGASRPFGLSRDAGAEIDQRAEDVEEEGTDGAQRRARQTLLNGSGTARDPAFKAERLDTPRAIGPAVYRYLVI